MPEATLREQTIAGSDGISITLAVSKRELFFRYRPPEPVGRFTNLHLVLGTHREIGARFSSQHTKGQPSSCRSNAICSCRLDARAGQLFRFLRKWERWRWSEREQTKAFATSRDDGEFVFCIPAPARGREVKIDFALYAKDPNANNGWGWFGDAPIAALRMARATNTFRISTSSI